MINGGAPLAALICMLSAVGFATSSALQHRVAGRVPTELAQHAGGVLGQVVRKPLWLLAAMISFSALLLHATALKLGSVALVQPLMLVGVVFAVPLRAAMDRTTPTWRELRAVLITVGGLAAFVIGVDPASSARRPSLAPASLMVLVGLGTAVVMSLTATRIAPRPRQQAAILGATSGAMFGLTAGLLKLVGATVSSAHPAACALPCAALVGAGALGTAMNQRAYHIAPLSDSMPVLNVVDVLVAVSFGALVFHETPEHTPVIVLARCLALACLAIGLTQIARLGSRPSRSVALTTPERPFS